MTEESEIRVSANTVLGVVVASLLFAGLCGYLLGRGYREAVDTTIDETCSSGLRVCELGMTACSARLSQIEGLIGIVRPNGQGGK